jgi:hypothetical protein
MTISSLLNNWKFKLCLTPVCWGNYSESNHSLDSVINLGEHFLVKISSTVYSVQILGEIFQRHWITLPFHVVIMLIHVQHDGGVSQRESRIGIDEWFVIAILKIE